MHKEKGYDEQETFGIITRNFESNKFLDVAETIEDLLYNKDIKSLATQKLYNILYPYRSEIEKLRDFSNKIVKIGEKKYELKVYILNPIDEKSSEVKIEIKM